MFIQSLNMPQLFLLFLRIFFILTLLHAERPKLHGALAILSAIVLKGYTPFTATTSVNAKTVKSGHVVFTVEYTDEDGDSPLTYSITSTTPAGAPFQFSAGMFISYWFKGRLLNFRRYHNFANLFSKLSENTFYKEISEFQ